MTPAVTTDDGFEACVRGVDVVLFPGWLVVKQLAYVKS